MDDEARYLFMRTLGVELSVARALEGAGFTSVEEVAYVPVDELLEVKSVPEHRLIEIRKVAREYLMKDALGNRAPPWEASDV
jgi:transcription termination/antitermination protein NusA